MSRFSPLCVLCALCAFVLNPLTVAAQTTFDPAARAAAIAPLVNDQTIAVGHVDLERLDAAAIVALLGEVVPPGEPGLADQLSRLEQAIKAVKTAFRAGGMRELYAVVSLQELPKEPGFFAAPLAAGTDARAAAELLKGLTRSPAGAVIGNLAVAGKPVTIARLKTMKATPRPDLAKAFALAGDTAIQAIVSPTDDTRRVIREMLPRLPDEIGGGSGAVLADGLRWVVVSANMPPKLSLGLTVQAQDEAAAAALRGLALGAIEKVREGAAAPGGAAKPAERESIEALLQLLTPQLKGNQLVISRFESQEDVERLARVVIPALQATRIAAGRAQSVNNLKQLGLAMHNFHDLYNHFPPQAIRSKDGRALLSWRVAILPYFGQQALFDEFKLDQPWDSEHNRKLIERLPPILASPHLGDALIAKGMTSYLVPLTKAPPAVSLVKPDDLTKPIVSGKDETIFDVPQGTTMARIIDGTSNTILIAEVHPKSAVIWTQPDDLVVNAESPLEKFAGQPNSGFNVVLADSSVRFISLNVDLKLFWNLLRMNDGNALRE